MKMDGLQRHTIIGQYDRRNSFREYQFLLETTILKGPLRGGVSLLYSGQEQYHVLYRSLFWKDDLYTYNTMLQENTKRNLEFRMVKIVILLLVKSHPKIEVPLFSKAPHFAPQASPRPSLNFVHKRPSSLTVFTFALYLLISFSPPLPHARPGTPVIQTAQPSLSAEAFSHLPNSFPSPLPPMQIAHGRSLLAFSNLFRLRLLSTQIFTRFPRLLRFSRAPGVCSKYTPILRWCSLQSSRLSYLLCSYPIV